MGKDSGSNVLADSLTFTFEPVDYVMKDGLADMSRRHWEETVDHKTALPYEPDWDRYRSLEAENRFRIVAVRFGGHLVGYAGLNLSYNINSKNTLGCFIQEYYIEKSFRRKAECGKKLFRFIQDMLPVLKVSYIVVEAPNFSRGGKDGLGRFFQILGYTNLGGLWARSI